MSVISFMLIGFVITCILWGIGLFIHYPIIIAPISYLAGFVLLLVVVTIGVFGSMGSRVNYQVTGAYQGGQLAVQQKKMSSDTWFNLKPGFMNNVDNVNASIQNDFKHSGIMIKFEDGDQIIGKEVFEDVDNPNGSSVKSDFVVTGVKRLNKDTNFYEPISLVAKVSDVDFTYHKSGLAQVNHFKNVNLNLSDDEIKKIIIDQANILDLQESDQVQGTLTYHKSGGYDFTVTHLSRIEPSGDYQVIK